MNFRVSFVLVVLVAVVGGYVLLFELQQQPPPPATAPWFYDVEMSALIGISITHLGQEQVFVRRADGEWVFLDSGEIPDPERWSGIPLLLTGPRSTRVLDEPADDLSEYGLDPPITSVRVDIAGGIQFNFILGVNTADGSATYGRVIGSDAVFLLTSSWAPLLTMLVTDPPRLTGTPVPPSSEFGE